MRTLILGVSLAGLILTSACAGMSPRQQRMLSGGAIGAGGGALLGAVTGGSPALGALIGGVAGTAVGAVAR